MDSLDHFLPLLGAWQTEQPGAGLCPTGKHVRFDETFSFERFGDSIRYQQLAQEAGTGATLHHESGVFRASRGASSDTEFELALVMNSGRLELATASFEDGLLRTESHTFFNDRKGAKGLSRTFQFSADECSKTLFLATSAWPTLTRHMWSELKRSG